MTAMELQIQDRRLMHASYLFDVQRCRIQLPTGQLVERDLVEHPGAALILPVTDDGQVVMIRQMRYAVGGEIWELPCGTLEEGEDPAACAARELTEETGYAAAAIEPLGRWWSCPGYSNERIFAYLATGLQPGQQNLDDHEHIDVELMEKEKIRRLLVDNRIDDAKTIAALSLYFMREA
jgi:ADP-ribose pyrophosphatase